MTRRLLLIISIILGLVLVYSTPALAVGPFGLKNFVIEQGQQGGITGLVAMKNAGVYGAYNNNKDVKGKVGEIIEGGVTPEEVTILDEIVPSNEKIEGIKVEGNGVEVEVNLWNFDPNPKR